MSDFDDDRWAAGILSTLVLICVVMVSTIPILEFMESGYSLGVAIGLTILLLVGIVAGIALGLGFVWLAGGVVLNARENISAWRERLE